MKQIGRTSKSEDFTSIFAPESSHGGTISSCRPLLISMPHSGGTCTGRGMAITRVKIRGLGALEAWVHSAKTLVA